MEDFLNNFTPSQEAVFAAFKMRLDKLTQEKKAKDSDMTLRIDEKEAVVLSEVFAFMEVILSNNEREEKRKEVTYEKAINYLNISEKRMKGLLKEKIISYRKEAGKILVSEDDVDKYAIILQEERSEGIGRMIKMNQEMGLYK